MALRQAGVLRLVAGAHPLVAHGLTAQRAFASVTRTRGVCRLAPGVSLLCASALTSQRRHQFVVPGGNRDHEAFLAQFDPLEVLCLDDTCNVDDIDEAFNRLSQKYGPQGPCPDAKLASRVKGAYDILKDGSSPFYQRAHVSDSHRRRLQFQLMPPRSRRIIEVLVAILGVAVVGLVLLVAAICFRPAKRAIRAATR